MSQAVLFFRGSMLSLLAAMLFGGAVAQSLPDTTWVRVGPDGGGVRFEFSSDRHTPGKFVTLVDSGYAYVTTNTGAQWTPFTNPGSYTWFSNLFIHPANSNLLFADGSRVDPITGWVNKSLRSSDAGATWNEVPYSPVIVPPSSADTMYAFTQDSIKISVDGGKTYSARAKIPFGFYTFSNGGAVNNNAHTIFLHNYSDTVYRSTDAGLTWAQVTFGESVLTGAITNGPAGSHLLYANHNDYVSGYYLWRSHDDGATWTQIAVTGFAGSGQIYRVFTAPSDSNRVWALCSKDNINALYRSTDGGATWTKSPRSVNGEMNGTFSTTDANVFLAVMYGNIYKTTDNGDTWTESDLGINAHTIHYLATDPSAATMMFGDQSVLYRSSDHGTTWSNTILDTLGYNLTVREADSTVSYLVGGKLDMIYRSTDKGSTWTPITTGLVNAYFSGTNAGGLDYIATDPYDNQVLYANWGYPSKTWRSTDGGANWTKIDSSGLYGITVCKRNNSILYAMAPSASTGPSTDVPKKSTDRGLTWTTIGAGFLTTVANYGDPAFVATDVVVSPVNPANALVAGYYHTNGGDTLRVYRTNDGGASWSYATTGLPQKFNASGLLQPAIAIAMNPANASQLALVSQKIGVFISNDGGASWTAIKRTGLNYSPITCKFVNFGGQNVLAVGLSAGNIAYYKLASTSLGVNDAAGLPGRFALGQNYPNPFNPSTAIRYSLPAESFVTLAVYNVLGQRMETLVSGRQTAGEQSILWNAANMASGVYFYRLDATSISNGRQFTEMKKMALIR